MQKKPYFAIENTHTQVYYIVIYIIIRLEMAQKGRVRPLENGLTPKQMKFCTLIAQWESGTQSALQTYDTDDYGTAQAIASENLSKPIVKSYLANLKDKAKKTVSELMDKADKDSVRLNAAKFVIEQTDWRAGAKDWSDKGWNTNITINMWSFSK